MRNLAIAGQTQKLETAVVKNIFRDIVTDMISNFPLNDHKPVNKRRRVNPPMLRWQFGRSSCSYYDPPPSLVGTDMADIYGYCLDYGLTAEKEGILEKFKQEANDIEPSKSQIVIIPFLQQLLTVLEAHRVPASSEPYPCYFQTLIISCIHRYVGMEPAQNKVGQTVYPCDALTTCVVCPSLDKFLADGSRATAKFPENERHRTHMLKRLPLYCFRTETIKQGSPYTLVVTKRELGWKLEHEEWEKRRNLLADEIRSTKFEEVLGRKFEDILEMRDLKSTGPAVNVHKDSMGISVW